MNHIETQSLAREMLSALDGAELMAPPSQRYPGLTFDDAYRVAAEVTRLRQERRERPVGRKIGYTNRNIWAQYNMAQPIWDHVYAHTVQLAPDNSAGEIITTGTLTAAMPVEPGETWRTETAGLSFASLSVTFE